MAKCLQCGAESYGKFCTRCGALLQKVCPVCGEKVTSDAKFCLSCGNPFSETRSGKDKINISDVGMIKGNKGNFTIEE